MKFLSFFVVVVFISLSLFSFTAMLDSEGMRGASPCLASLAQNGACPPQNSFGLALFHTNAFKVFSTALVSVVLLAGLVLLCAYFAVASLALFVRARSFVVRAEALRSRLALYKALARLRATLARFELSPALA